ncbi:MAG TPA: methionyl-tRNA formyltransferase [Candidatus Paceibacterota bacterium]|nr:methionyl-tRNA formyltransferase [Candidatus Paceibacterota bacterium]
MRYVFFGTPGFAAIILEKLIEAGMPPALVVCNPDKPAGRKKIITPPPVKKLLIEKFKDLKIGILQPESLKNFQFGEVRPPDINVNLGRPNLQKFDFCVVAAYGKIIPKSVLDTSPAKFIGVHPSLLPKYRGATPIQSAILAGDEVTGVTLYLMDDQVDHGPILVQQELEILNSNFETLNRKLAEMAGDLLVDFLNQFREVQSPHELQSIFGRLNLRPQNDKEATYTKKFCDEDGFVDLEKDDIAAIERKIRALNPEPGVWTYAKTLRQFWEVRPPNIAVNLGRSNLHEYKRVKILEAEVVDGKLKLKKVQFEGKKPQTINGIVR